MRNKFKNRKRTNFGEVAGTTQSSGKNSSFAPVYRDELPERPGMNSRLEKLDRAKVAHIDERGDIVEREALYGFERGNDERIISSPIIRQAIGLVKGRYFSPEFVRPFFISPDLRETSSDVKIRKIFGSKISNLFRMQDKDPTIGYPAFMTFWRIPDAFGALSSSSLVFQIATFGGKTSETLMWDSSFMHPNIEAEVRANLTKFLSSPGIEFPNDDRIDVEGISALFEIEEEVVRKRGNKFIPQVFLDCIHGLSETWPVRNRDGSPGRKANRMADTTIPMRRVINWVRNAPVVESKVNPVPHPQEKAPGATPMPVPDPVQEKAPKRVDTAPAVDPSDLVASLRQNQITKKDTRPTVKTVNMDE